MQQFEAAYGKLNPEQKRAVDTIEGPVMVIAGPGTGKTQILTLRIANILKQTDTDAGAILALTFTEAGVSAMRERLASFIGAQAYAVGIHTYHSFAERLVREHGDYLPRLRDGALIDEVDQREILERAFDTVSVPLLTTRNDPYRAIGEVVRFIDEAKRELYTPQKLREEYQKDKARIKAQSDFIHEKGAHKGKVRGEYAKALQKIEKNLQATDVFRVYEELLLKESRYDFQDLLLEVVRALQNNEEFKQVVQEQFQYLLADEHQDANATQNQILLELADFHEAPNIFVVGDEKQAIYRFQGADLDTFLTLKERYPSSEVILLETNYRSTQQVLDAAHALIGKAPIPDPSLRKELVAHHGSGANVRVCKARDTEDEIAQVTAHIQKLLTAGVAGEDIAVLVRRNGDAFPIAYACMRAGIAYTLMARENVLMSSFAQLFLHLLRAVWSGDTVALSKALFVPGIISNPMDRVRLLDAIRKERTSFLEGIDGEGFVDGEEIQRLGETLRALHEEAHILPAARVVPHIVDRLRIVEGIAKRLDSQELYEVLEALLHDVEKFAATHPGADIGMYLERVERIQKHDLAIVQAKKRSRGVQIMTTHGSKGLEFPYVIIPFATDKRYGSKRGKELSIPGGMNQEDHDERRLLYVALTRAEKEVLITYAQKNTLGRSETPSRFLYDVEELIEDMEAVETELSLVAPEQPTELLDVSYIRERLLAGGISATAYGNYKSSPWKYVFRNLLRLPEGKTVPLIFGSAVHAALEEAGKMVRNGEAVDVEKALGVFEQEMEHSDLTVGEKKEHIPTGKEMIQAYLAQVSFGEIAHVEFQVQAPFEVPDVGVITLRGNLDRVDRISGNAVRVVDYKTGKPKSENEIRGKTGLQDPSYYVQLMFYALLLKHDPAHAYEMQEGVLEFVEPNESGKYVSRSFAINAAELDDFEKELRQDLSDIANGAFVNAPPAEEYQALLDMLIADSAR